jgi:hypothetical protein
MKKSLFIIVLSLVMVIFVNASEKESETVPPVTTMNIGGVITDVDTDETLAGVLVTIEGTELQTLTDLDGKFSFDGLEIAEYNLKLTYISYKEVEVKEIKIDNHSEELDLKLESE